MDYLTTTDERVKVLMTGAGAPGGPGIIKALQQGAIDLFVGDANPVASGRFLAGKFVQLPSAGSPEFAEFVLSFCRANGIQVVFPLVTRELFVLAAEKERFRQHNVRVIVSDYDSLCTANDKGRLYTHLLQSGISVPAFRIATKRSELEAAVRELGYPAKAVCVKPTVSNGSRGVRILQENVDEFDLLFNYKPNNLYSSLPKLLEILGERSFPELLVSDYLPGEEYTVDTLVYKGEPKLVLPRVRTKMNGGISVQGTFVRHEQIIRYCEDIIRSLQLSGPIGLQVKADENGTFKLLEINPRIQGTSVAAMGLGINLPLLCVQQEFGAPDFSDLQIAWGTSFVRYYQEVFY